MKFEPALPEGVVPPSVQTPADWKRTEHPTVAGSLLVVGVLCMLPALVTALLCAGRSMVDAEDDCMPASV